MGGPTAAGVAAIPGRTVNALADAPEPPLVCTAIVPVAAVKGTVALTLVDEITVTDGLATPWKLTVIGATKFVPVIVTDVFNVPEVGAKTLIVGAAAKVPAKPSELIARTAKTKHRFL